MAQLLTFDLSAATNLHAQMKQAHWNVQKGDLVAECAQGLTELPNPNGEHTQNHLDKRQ